MTKYNRAAAILDSRAALRRADLTATLAWFVLIMLTIAIWWLSELPEGSGRSAGVTAPMAIVVIAFVKIQIVIHRFMEIGSASRTLQAVMAGWTLATCLCVLFYIGKLA